MMRTRTHHSPQRALLTGYHGFTGRYVAAELEAAGYEVVGLAHDGDPPCEGVLRANLLDRAAVRRAVSEARADVDETYRSNAVGTRNLLEALADAEMKPRSVVLTSSANIHGNASVDSINGATPAPVDD